MNFIDEQIELLNQKHSNNPYVAPQVLNSITDNNNGISDFDTWIQAAGIGAGNMLNNTIFGGLGQILGSIGAGVEYVSPFSGSQANERINLLRLGIPYETAKEIYPDQDSWLTSLAKGSLGIQNTISDKINAYRSNIFSDNPDYGTQVAEGTGSSLGFMGAGMGASYLAGLAGLGPLGIILAGALAAGGLEALSESGGTLGEAYRLGKYDEGGLAAANKSFLTNAALNFTLDSGLGFFAPWTAGIRNPITKFAARTAGSVLNELIQEPSQQVIEKSAVESLNNGGNFMTALGHELPHWWETAKQLAPSVAGSSLLTSLITGGAGLANPNIRRTVASQFAHRDESTKQAQTDLQKHYDAIAKLRRRIEREQTTGNNQAVIDSLNHRIEKRIRQIQRLTDTFSLYNFTPAPSNRFDGNISQVVTRDGNPAVNTQFMLIDASDLITSHNDDFTPNPNFNQTQPRFRGREEAQNEVAKMAATLDPNSLGEDYHAQSGAPIVALVDGKYQTISGNGRVMATRRAYSQHPEKAQNYRQFIIDNASRFGVDPDLARKLKHPVLVRRIVDENIDLAKFANEANESNIQALSTAENATKDAQNLTDDIISKYDPDKDIAHNSDFLEAFRGIIPENERNAFFDTNGNLSKNGEIRVQNALLAYAYGNREIISKLSEQANDVSRNVSKALVNAAPDFVKLKKGNVRQDLILDEDIAQAVLRLDQYRNSNKTVDEQIAQRDLTGNDGTTINETLNDENSTTRAKLSEEAQLLLQFFHEFRDSPNAILRGLRRYALVASSQPEQGQQTLFDDEALNAKKIDLLRWALGDKLLQNDNQAQNNAQNTQGQGINQQGEGQNTTDDTQIPINQINSNPQGARFVRPSTIDTAENTLQEQKDLRRVSTPLNFDDDMQTIPPLNDAQTTDDDMIERNFDTTQNTQNQNIVPDAQSSSEQQAKSRNLPVIPHLNPVSTAQNINDNNIDNANSAQDGNLIAQNERNSEHDNSEFVSEHFRIPNILGNIDTQQGQGNQERISSQNPNENSVSGNQNEGSNSHEEQKSPSNPVQNQGQIQNQQVHRKNQPNFIPNAREQIKSALRKGKEHVRRFFFFRKGEKDTRNPHKSSFDSRLTSYDGYIGDLDIGIGENSANSHLFFGLQDGNPFVGFTDNDGNFVATYDVRNNQFYINEGSEHSAFARRIEADFRREFGHNPTEELLRRWFMHKAINAGLNNMVADAVSRVYLAGNKYFAHYSGRSLLDTVLGDNLSIKRSNRKTRDRGDTTFIPEIRDSEGNIIQEARTIVSLYRHADESTLLHETAHIFLRKLRDLHRAGLLTDKNGNPNQAAIDWGNIMKEYGLYKIDFSKELTDKQFAKWLNANEKIAASFEQYFWNENAPKGLTAKMREVFSHLKEWLKNIYHSLGEITYTDNRGRKHNDFSYSPNLKAFFDRLLKGSNEFSINENNDSDLDFSDYNSNQGMETFSQAEFNRKGLLGRAWDWLKRVGKHALHPLYSIAHVEHQPSTIDRIAPFLNPETERRFTEAGKTLPRQGVLGRISHAFKDAAKSIIGGDYSDITNSPRINDKALNLLGALQSLRTLERNKKNALHDGREQILKVLRTLNPQQYELFNRLRVLQDLDWQIKDMPDSALPFELTPDEVRKALKQYTDIAHQPGNEAVLKAIQDEEQNMRETYEEYLKWAKLLGHNMDGVFRNPHYYRHRIIEYAQAIRSGYRHHYSQGNLDVQEAVDNLMFETQGRSWLKKRKGSNLDFITNYMEANAEVRIQMLQDIETMKTLFQIKRDFDIAPKIRKKFNLAEPKMDNDVDGAESFSQSGDGQQDTIFDHVPENFEVFDINSYGGIEGYKSAYDNIVDMAVPLLAEEHHFPLDRIFEALGIEDSKSLMVIPSEIAETLRKMARVRQRGVLAQAAKDFTTWWKRSVLFTPTRNLLYNIRNFTGDIDALIAGNPHALKFLPQSIKELVDYYLHNGKEGYSASQDLQDYIRLSGQLGIPSLNLSKADAQMLTDLLTLSDPKKLKNLGKKKGQKILDRIKGWKNDTQNNAEETDTSILKKAWQSKWNLIAKWFNFEHSFTEMREHLLRFAAYLDYKQQMESNQDGKPNNWGASLEDEVMAVKDIKERAFKMSNELLGAYDQVSEIGKQLRDMLIPFYSWMEVNMRRTWRLLRNGFKYGYGARQAKQLALGKLASMPLYTLSAAQSVGKLLLFTGALQMFNRFFRADADDDLPYDVKYRPHLTLGKMNGQVYYFDRIGAIADALDWFHLDSIWFDAKDLANGQQTIGGYLKKMAQAPFSKAINGLNPAIKMPIELAMGRSMFPDAFNPSTIRDPAEYVARSFGMAWPYKAITGKPHDNMQELTRLFVYSQDEDEAAYWQTLDRVRQFQNQILDRHFDGFASTARGRILQNLKKALRFNDREAVRRFLREYTQADGTKQGLKASMKAMNPLHGLSEKEKAQFLRWISPDDRKYLRKAMRYFHQLADRYIQ